MNWRFVLLAAAGASCAQHTVQTEPTLRGIFSIAFELNELRRCGSSERWWVWPASQSLWIDLQEQVAKADPIPAGADRPQSAYVELVGDTTTLGTEGQLGFRRNLTFRSIRAVRATRDSTC